MLVPIVVAPNAAQGKGAAGDTGLFCYVRKRPVSVVSIKSIPRRNSTVVEITAADEVDVHEVVAIEVRHADARAGFFQNRGSPVVALEMDEVDSCKLRHIVKLDGRCRLRWGGST